MDCHTSVTVTGIGAPHNKGVVAAAEGPRRNVHIYIIVSYGVLCMGRITSAMHGHGLQTSERAHERTAQGGGILAEE